MNRLSRPMVLGSWLLGMTVLFSVGSPAPAATIYVGPARTYTTIQAGVNAAYDGDTILVDVATYAGSDAVATITKSLITIKGNGGLPVLDYTGVAGPGLHALNGCSDVTFDSLEAKCTTTDACIYSEAGGTTMIRNCVLHDACKGFRVSGSVLPYGGGLYVAGCHIYNGTVSTDAFNSVDASVQCFVLKGSWIHNATGGYEIKTSAKFNYVMYNRLGDEQGWIGGGRDGRIIDFVQGGMTYVIGNVMNMATDSANGAPWICYMDGGQLGSGYSSQIYVLYNTMLGRRSGPMTVLDFTGVPTATPAYVANNVFVNSSPSNLSTGPVLNNVAMTSSNIILYDHQGMNPPAIRRYMYDINGYDADGNTGAPGAYEKWYALDVRPVDPNTFPFGAGCSNTTSRWPIPYGYQTMIYRALVPGTYPAALPATGADGTSLLPDGQFVPMGYNGTMPGWQMRPDGTDVGAQEFAWSRPGLPVITSQSVSQVARAGQPATFSVTVSGTGPYSYQWRRNGFNLVDGGRISGAATSTVAVNPVTPDDQGDYDVIVTNASGSTTNGAATLTVVGYVYVAGGYNHSLALANGEVWAWGRNNVGQLGDGTTTDRSAPTKVSNLTDAITIGSGEDFSLAIKSNGTVWAWGCNAVGQLGDGTTTERHTPVQVVGVTEIVAVTGGYQHAMALRSDGTVWTWGWNVYGQLGDNSTTNRPVPMQVSGLTNVSAIAAGAHHSIALKSDGTVWAWGLNDNAQLGDGTTTNRLTPMQVSGLTGIVRVAAGAYHSLAVRSDGVVMAWGDNYSGQMGDGTKVDRSIAVPISGLTGAVDVVGGSNHCLALKSDGTAWAWGSNTYGQLGDGSTTARYTPAQASSLTGAIAVASGVDACHSLALKSNGTVWTWGGNQLGQLGDGTTSQRNLPVQTQVFLQISPQSVSPGSTASFSVTVAGPVPLSYQWRKDGINLTDNGRISGATTSTLTISSVGLADQANYDVVVTNTYGSAASNQAALTLNVPVTKLVCTGGRTSDLFGNSVGISGNVAVLGAPYQDYSYTDSGQACIFRFNGSTWVQEQILGAPDRAANDNFGSVAIDGNVTVVGAPGHDGKGAVYVFRYSGTGWAQEQELQASDGANGDRFGQNIAIAGNVIVIGAYASDVGASDAGAAYVFRYNGTSWVQEQKLTAADAAAGDYFGASVGISGNVIAVGAYKDDDHGLTDVGSAYVFRYNGSAWVQEQKLLASNGAADDNFGGPVAICADTILAGAAMHDSNGSAYVFRYVGGSWVQQQELRASDGAAVDRFGCSLALDAGTAVIGAYRDDDMGTDSGSAYIFMFDGTQWVQVRKLVPSDGRAGDGFGTSVALSSGNVLAGSPYGDNGYTDSGGAYIFSIGTPPSIITQPVGQSVTLAQAAAISVVATGSPTLTYQWRKDGTNLTDDGRISGATTPTLTINSVTMQDTQSVYDVVVSNGCGSVTSQPVYIMVQDNFDWQLGDGVPGVNGSVYATTTWSGPRGECLVVGGSFNLAGQVSANNVATWDGTSWHPLGSGINGTVNALTVYNGQLVAGGSFSTAGGVTCNYIARWDGTSWQSLGSGMNGTVQALTVYSGQLVAGGSFSTAGGVTCNYIARWDGTSWQSLGSGMDSAVYALTVYNGQLVAGGSFSTAGGVTCNYIARWDGTSWQSLGSGMSSTVRSLTVYNGQLVAGGSFSTAGGVTCNRIARWDGTSWQSLGSGMDSTVQALTVYNGQLVAGGSFSTAGGVTCNYTARWDGSSWQTLGSGTNSSVYALTVYDGQLVAGGSFTSAGGVTCNCIARWDGTSWQPLGSGMNNSVSALTVYNGQLVAGGYFTTAGGGICNCIARWDGSSWQPLGSGMNSTVQALTVYNGQLVAGGYFSTAGGRTSAYVARWGLAPTILQQPASQSVLAANPLVLSVSATGSGTLTYQWRKDRVNLQDDARISGATSPTLTIANMGQADVASYDVIITDANGNVASMPVGLTVLPPVPTNPSPADGQIGVPANVTLSWNIGQPGMGQTYDVYLDTVSPPIGKYASGLTSPTFTPSTRLAATRYYWKVVAINNSGQTEGPVWTFTTTLAGDIDGDGHVNLADLKLLVAAWNTTLASPTWNPAADLDGDGSVNLADLKILVANWNKSV